MANVLAVDIGSSNFRVGLFDQTGSYLKVTEDPTSTGPPGDWLLEQVRNRCSVCLQESPEPVTACGVSFGGLVDFDRQLVTSLHGAGWDRFPLAAWFQQSLGLPCRVDSDANAGALGELRFGAGKGTNSLAFVMISTWLRCGLICCGQLWRGKDSLAGALGHVPVSDPGALCSCGATGCLELFCSGAAIAQEGREYASRRPEELAAFIGHQGDSVDQISAKTVAEAAAQGDTVALYIMGEAARWLARGILTLIRIFNPDKIILGGGVVQAGPVLLNPLRDALKSWQSSNICYTTGIVPAELGTRSSLYGAAALALDLSGGEKPITT